VIHKNPGLIYLTIRGSGKGPEAKLKGLAKPKGFFRNPLIMY
jgi:crotonobetainyl-CoA:carnitine CoA-transferase CaiB-like acyl-CoA transferase